MSEVQSQGYFCNSFEQELQNHLKTVYLCLFTIMASTAAGCSLYCVESFQHGTISSIMSFVLIIALHFHRDSCNFWLRFSVIVCLGFCTGQLLGPFMMFVGLVDPRLVISSLIGSTVLFLSLTLTARYFRSLQYRFTDGALVIVSNILTIISIINLFLKSDKVQDILLHLGLAVTAGFVLFDTQEIMEKFQCGDTDSINHSLILFFHMLNLSRKLLILVVENRIDVDEEL